MQAQRKPRVLVPVCHRQIDGHPVHLVGRKYAQAVRLAGCLPVLVSDANADDLDEWLALADGVLLTGSPSNVHPSHFGEAVHDTSLPLDRDRDAFTLALIPRALAMGLPLLAICRGFQEVNVALGGSLHQTVHELPGMADHRPPPEQPNEIAYGPQHEIDILPGGRLEALLGTSRLLVNSLHGQGIRQLAPGLQAEALAPDGLVEAFSVAGSSSFALGVQWHPEWQAETNPASMALLRAFGGACVAYQHIPTRLALSQR